MTVRDSSAVVVLRIKASEYEIALLMDFMNERWAIEFKLTTLPSPSVIMKLVETAYLIADSHCFLVLKAKSEPAKLSISPVS